MEPALLRLRNAEFPHPQRGPGRSALRCRQALLPLYVTVNRVLLSKFHPRGQKGLICTRDSSDGGKYPRYAPVMNNMKDDGGKRSDFAPWFEVHHLPAYLNCSSNVRQNQTLDQCYADRQSVTAELTPRCFVRPSYRLLRPRCRENLYPAGTSHFPRPWGGHVRRG